MTRLKTLFCNLTLNKSSFCFAPTTLELSENRQKITPTRCDFKKRRGENPIAEKISQHIVNLPTHIGMNHIDMVADFLKRNRGNIYSNYQEILKI
jgi:dTDP-4-amino-4,6-dideoxygalactose transaminase